jgi:hypothetical protein
MGVVAARCSLRCDASLPGGLGLTVARLGWQGLAHLRFEARKIPWIRRPRGRVALLRTAAIEWIACTNMTPGRANCTRLGLSP